jgi:hypothetical protein
VISRLLRRGKILESFFSKDPRVEKGDILISMMAVSLHQEGSTVDVHSFVSKFLGSESRRKKEGSCMEVMIRYLRPQILTQTDICDAEAQSMHFRGTWALVPNVTQDARKVSKSAYIMLSSAHVYQI